MRNVLLVFRKSVTERNLLGLLARSGFRCLTSDTHSKAFSIFESENVDVLITQLRLTDQRHASDFCRTIRKQWTVPILVIADSGQEYDELSCLEAGADDYLTAECSDVVFVARLHALLRRVNFHSQGCRKALLNVGNVTLDHVRLVATCGGSALPLTPTEFKLLGLLSRSLGQTLSREELLKEVWRSEYEVDRRLVDAHIRNLRVRMRSSGTGLAIVTVRGVGYRLVTHRGQARRAIEPVRA